MSDRLDDLVGRLAGSPPDRPLDGFEAEVGRSIARRRRDMRDAVTLAPVRVASLGLALAMGVTAGGAAATAALLNPQPLSVFSSSAHLAPSNLLEGGE
jgi:hypothetical protein